ncbi:hypothetical protein [Kutzneria sp. CA-103260]|uniref:hypothetical protein n=1 Tax=Kutzneria sp. CA-103260 TaxID=2802641 RepID=UPI001BA46853|nr:hypothetical protein [Kutzneria sp. CA-103260]
MSSLAGMTFSLIASVWLWTSVHSAVLSALVFGGQWVGAAVFPSGTARVIRRLTASRIAPVTEWCGAALVATAAGFIAAQLWMPLVCVVLIKGYVDSVGRTANTLVARERADGPGAIEHEVSRMEFFRLVGSTSAGTAFAVTGQYVDPVMFAMLCAAGHGFAGLGLRWHGTQGGSARTERGTAAEQPGVRQLRRMTSIQRGALLQLSLIAAYQGLHNSIRTVYPIQQLHQGTAGVGIVSAVATAGVFAGGWISSRKAVLPWAIRYASPAGLCATALLAIAAVACTAALPSYALYFLFLAAFEAAFMGCNARYVASLDDATSVLFVGIRSTALSLSALAGLLAASALLALLPPSAAVAATASALAAASLLYAVATIKKERRAPNADVRLPG